jgi:hypothetical protein
MELHKKTQIEIQRLIDATGHALTLDDIPAILELNEVANRITGESGEYADIHAWPVKCGGTLLKPLTVGKLAWYNKRGLQWFADDAQTITTLLAFILAAENDESSLWQYADAESAKAAIDEWEKTIDATPAQIVSAIESLTAPLRSTEPDGENTHGDGPLISLLCREYGNTPDYWLYRASINVIRALIEDHNRRINQEIQSHNRRAKGKTIQPIKTPGMAATLQFKKLLSALGEKWGANGG